MADDVLDVEYHLWLVQLQSPQGEELITRWLLTLQQIGKCEFSLREKRNGISLPVSTVGVERFCGKSLYHWIGDLCHFAATILATGCEIQGLRDRSNNDIDVFNQITKVSVFWVAHPAVIDEGNLASCYFDVRISSSHLPGKVVLKRVLSRKISFLGIDLGNGHFFRKREKVSQSSV